MNNKLKSNNKVNPLTDILKEFIKSQKKDKDLFAIILKFLKEYRVLLTQEDENNDIPFDIAYREKIEVYDYTKNKAKFTEHVLYQLIPDDYINLMRNRWPDLEQGLKNKESREWYQDKVVYYYRLEREKKKKMVQLRKKKEKKPLVVDVLKGITYFDKENTEKARENIKKMYTQLNNTMQNETVVAAIMALNALNSEYFGNTGKIIFHNSDLMDLAANDREKYSFDIQTLRGCYYIISDEIHLTSNEKTKNCLRDFIHECAHKCHYDFANIKKEKDNTYTDKVGTFDALKEAVQSFNKSQRYSISDSILEILGVIFDKKKFLLTVNIQAAVLANKLPGCTQKIKFFILKGIFISIYLIILIPLISPKCMGDLIRRGFKKMLSDDSDVVRHNYKMIARIDTQSTWLDKLFGIPDSYEGTYDKLLEYFAETVARGYAYRDTYAQNKNKVNIINKAFKPLFELFENKFLPEILNQILERDPNLDKMQYPEKLFKKLIKLKIQKEESNQLKLEEQNQFEASSHNIQVLKNLKTQEIPIQGDLESKQIDIQVVVSL